MANERQKKYQPQYGDPDYWQWMKKVGGKAIMLNLRGKGKKIQTPTEMLELACEYFEETNNVFIETEDVFKSGDLAGTKYKIKHRRPYSWAGFNRFLLSRQIVTDIDNYRLNRTGAYDEYGPVMEYIGRIMYEQKFDGASAGVFSANIIARDLQMAENTIMKANIDANVKAEVDAKVEIDYSQLSDAALEEIARLQNPNDDKA